MSKLYATIASLGTKTLVIIALVLVIFIGAGVYSCQQRGQERAQGAQNERSASATAAAAEEALATVVARSEADADIDDIVEQTLEEIDNAEGSDTPITPAVRSAALRGACRLRAYRDDPACAVFAPDPR